MTPLQRLTWARTRPVASRLERTVLLVLASYTDSEGRAFPSQRELAATCLVQEPAIRAALKGLLEAHTIRRSTRMKAEGRGRRSDAYELVIQGGPTDGLAAVGPVDQPAIQARPTGDSATTNRRSTLPHIEEGDSKEVLKGERSRQDLQSETDDSSVAQAFEGAWRAYPEAGRRKSASKAHSLPDFVRAAALVGSPRRLSAAVRAYSASAEAKRDDGKFVPGFQKFLREGRYEHWFGYEPITPDKREMLRREMWQSRLGYYRTQKYWKEIDWGPRPTNPECTVDHDLLVEAGYRSIEEPLKVAGGRS